jgi:cell division septation protein DedD
MREETVRAGPARSRERFDLSLDGRQIAAMVVGSLVVLGVVFALGLNVGRQLARREAEAARPPDALEALDRPPVPPAPPVQTETLTYHERLTQVPPRSPVLQARTPETVPANVQPRAALAPATPAPSPADPAPKKGPSSPGTAQAATAPDEPSQTDASSPGARSGWCVQLGAVHDRAEADRIAARFRSAHPRIEEAEVSGKRWYRVRAGAFESRTEAERSLEQLARQTGAKGYVTASR